MRVAAIYDIHGNLPALDAVLAEIERLDADIILVGGDVAWGPMPRATLDRLMSLGDRARFIRGNTDRDVVANYDGHQTDHAGEENWVARPTDWTAKQITAAQRDFLAGFPEETVLDVDGLGSVLFCHGSPRSDEEIITAATPEAPLQEMLAGVAEQIVVCGHTHMQFDRAVAGKRVLNAGSVGMPYEGQPGAYWLLLDGEARFQRTTYDLAGAASATRQSGMPIAEEFAADNILRSPSGEEATAIFERMAGRE